MIQRLQKFHVKKTHQTRIHWWHVRLRTDRSSINVSLCVFVLFISSIMMQTCNADFSLTISLTAPIQTSPNKVEMDLGALFTSTIASDYVNNYVFVLNTNDHMDNIVPFDFNRVSFTNVLTGWEGGGIDPIFGSGGFGAPDAANYLQNGSGSVILAHMVIDTTGLIAGPFTVSFDDVNTDAQGQLFDGLLDRNVTSFKNLESGLPPGFVDIGPSQNFNITAVPEPSSLFLFGIASGLAGIAQRYQKKRKTRVHDA